MISGKETMLKRLFKYFPFLFVLPHFSWKQHIRIQNFVLFCIRGQKEIKDVFFHWYFLALWIDWSLHVASIFVVTFTGTLCVNFVE